MFFVAMGHVHNRHGAYQAGFHDGRHYEHDARAIRHYHSLAAEAHAERGYWEAERRCILARMDCRERQLEARRRGGAYDRPPAYDYRPTGRIGW